MPEDDLSEARMDKPRKEPCTGFIGKVSPLAVDPQLERIGVRPHLQHVPVVVGLKEDKIQSAERALKGLIEGPQIRYHGYMPLRCVKAVTRSDGSENSNPNFSLANS